MDRKIVINLDDLRQIIQQHTRYVLTNTARININDVTSILCNYIELDLLDYEIA